MLGMIEKVMISYQAQISGILSDILSAVLIYMYTLKDSTLYQGLLMVFVRLVLIDTEQVINFLASKSTPTGATALTFVSREWTRQHVDFQGGFKIKLSMIALSKLFQSPNPLLTKITVPGDLVLIPGTQTGPVTRSKVKQKPVASEEPLMLAIFKLLLREYHVQQTEADSISLSDTYSDEDSENELLEQITDDQDLIDPFVEQSNFDFFDDLIGYTAREENEDPDIISDPYYKTDLKQYIVALVKAFSQQNPANFETLRKLLPPLDIDVLKKLLS